MNWNGIVSASRIKASSDAALKRAAMRYTVLKERCAWEPVCFGVKDILRLLENTIVAELVVCHYGKHHWIGVTCEYDRNKRVFGDQTFYIDDQEFISLEEFAAHAVLNGRLLSAVAEPLTVIDTLEGDPALYRDLLAGLRSDIGEDV